MIELYTDGSCDNRKGDGGWGWVAISRAEGISASNGATEANLHPGDEVVSQGSGGFAPGSGKTNNAMELQAIYHALNWVMVARPEIDNHSISGIPLWTDSSYARKALTEYVPKWRLRGWTTSLGEPVANQAQMKYISRRLRQCHQAGYGIRIRHIKGHRYYWNEYADRLAGDARLAGALRATGPTPGA